MSDEKRGAKDIQKRIEEDATYRNSLISWLDANGIEDAGSMVPAGVRPSMIDGRMTIEVYVVNEHGRKQVDPMDPLRLARRTVTVDLVVPPTPEVELWATTPCPTCDR